MIEFSTIVFNHADIPLQIIDNIDLNQVRRRVIFVNDNDDDTNIDNILEE